jgi:N-carbamoyl-L-amino-acid hydrolase
VGFLEAHIEQGRRLERAGQSAAVVSSIVGLRQFSLVFAGEQNHAGTTTMADRKDAATAAFQFAVTLSERFKTTLGDGSHAVWTFGKLSITPGAASIVPGRVS